MPTVKCRRCDKDFYVKLNRLEKGWGRYCSNECKHISLQTGDIRACVTCGKGTYKSRKDQRRSMSGNFFCSKSCQTVWRNSVLHIGSDHTNWRTGINVYRDILKRTGVSQVCTKCKTEDARVLAVHHYANESVGFLVTAIRQH